MCHKKRPDLPESQLLIRPGTFRSHTILVYRVKILSLHQVDPFSSPYAFSLQIFTISAVVVFGITVGNVISIIQHSMGGTTNMCRYGGRAGVGMRIQYSIVRHSAPEAECTNRCFPFSLMSHFLQMGACSASLPAVGGAQLGTLRESSWEPQPL